ncbi:protein transport protein HofC [Mesocricetibacter intestinalis]|uniref:Protein transport protein HofC n=1 Tax=Mesocricetibacter intestinalis TaxID=1521930 RepID=A0A4R6V8U8_9PAST|nr:type II secretion system F family protein [Mesocricetibacter intestinalis]TDQ58142.1 protein transport protein HofC [Mesocricetibacter intestinalis]
MALKQYRWQAINRFNLVQKGLIVAASASQARQELFLREMRDIRLQRNWQFIREPGYAEVCDLLLQLALLLKSSLPLQEALSLLLLDCHNVRLNQWIRALLRDIESGLPLSVSVEAQGKYLSFQDCRLIQAGEMTGQLARVCGEIAVNKQQSLALRRKIQKISLYPLFVLIISLIMSTVLLLFIVPEFSLMYANNGAELPAITAALLFLSAFLQQYLGALILIIVLSICLFRLRLRHSSWCHAQKSAFINSVPLLGKIKRLSRLIAFCRSLQLMLGAGVPINQALESFLPRHEKRRQGVHMQEDFILTREIGFILQGIARGYSFSDSVGSELFPAKARKMLQVGEQSGELNIMLQHIAESYGQQLEHRIALLSQLLEPILMLIIGGLIGLIMLGMYLPIFNMGAFLQ